MERAEINGKEAWKTDCQKEGEDGNKGDEERGEKIKAKGKRESQGNNGTSRD